MITFLPALRAALASTEFADAELVPLADRGLAHHHVRLTGHPVLARIPKQSQMQLAALENLDHQAACFDRASASGHAPRLRGVLPPRPGLDRGALLVEFIDGRAASLPRDLEAIMTALARIHALPLAQRTDRAPLGDSDDPLASLVAEIEVQAGYLDAAELHPRARVVIDAELRELRALVAGVDRPAKHLITFDAHPGNFVIRPDGRAVIVDLEKCRYSYPALDLAHATLYTSTTWEPGETVALTPGDVAQALEVWRHEFVAAAGDTSTADLAWHLPLRRAMWLWSVTWCAKWRVLSAAATSGSPDGEDWASANSDDTLTAHVRGRVDHYLDDAVIARIVAELHEASELHLVSELHEVTELHQVSGEMLLPRTRG